MKKTTAKSKVPVKRRSSLLPGIMLVAVLVGVPFLVLIYQTRHTGLSIGQMFQHIFKGARSDEMPAGPEPLIHGKKIDFLSPQSVGLPVTDSPRIGSVTLVDLDMEIWMSLR
jgi:hypothetical protein